MSIISPNPAATLVLLNVTTKWPYKVLLVKRSAQAAFLPGAHVFPGGRVEEGDGNLARILAADAGNYDRFFNAFLGVQEPVFSFAAACFRETKEETGIDLLEAKSPSLTNLWPLSRWITPHGEARRFDTLFFLKITEKVAPSAMVLSTETYDQMWLTPQEALDYYQNQEIFLAPPTRAIMERLAASKSLEDVLAAVDKPIKPINPYFVEDKKHHTILVLPGDELHHEPRVSSFIMHTRYCFP